jgi:hypothetical protein
MGNVTVLTTLTEVGVRGRPFYCSPGHRLGKSSMGARSGPYTGRACAMYTGAKFQLDGHGTSPLPMSEVPERADQYEYSHPFDVISD